ncbi:response regulator [Paenibacillus eucommiae]|uniref:Two-component SAPR family response regulator n=1 Tax=Paenibacillus eucommiae TaxID=1355755 RepID=A0ABS4IWJ3_9BACL|nr:response regulator [Paenibacillus eucommiae]MBP1991937.1 two-component SAPR family response regulator [Paenibacillus eucommiae]
MIRVIAVDDEQPALKRIGQLLQACDEVQVCGLFDRANAFLEHALMASEPIDLVLLDMEMPGLHGLELARRLRAFRPEIHIAFLTAYEEYARDAFDVEALDYLLKPITKDDLARTLSRFVKRSGRHQAEEGNIKRGISVRSFGPFAVMKDNGESVHFRNSKGRELLAYLHHYRGNPVSKSQILDEIWQGRDVERSQVTLHSTVYQLRKDLEACGLQDTVGQTKTAGGSYFLRWSIAIDDVLAYEKEYQLYKQHASLTHIIQAIQLYGSGYLAGSGYGWAAPRQAELELSYTELLEAMVDIYVRQQRYEIALSPMQKWAQLLPLDVRLHAKMIALLLLMKREADALAYHKLALELTDQSGGTSEQDLDFSRISASPSSMF